MKSIIIIGYGNQAQAWAHNLKDSGWEVSIALRNKSFSITKASGNFKTIEISNIPDNSSVAILTPDETHDSILQKLENINCTIIYAHGHSLSSNQFNKKYSQHNHLLFAPKGIASAIRNNFIQNLPLAAVYSLEFSKNINQDRSLIFELASALGIGNLFEASFETETKADLFSEQTILCGVLPYMANLSFEKLREKGVSKEVAFLECWYEVKLIADVMVTLGPKKFFDLISPNALYGSQLGKNILINESTLSALDELYNDIDSGKFDAKVKNVNMDEIRLQVNNFWENKELTQVHSEMAPKLFKGDL